MNFFPHSGQIRSSWTALDPLLLLEDFTLHSLEQYRTRVSFVVNSFPHCLHILNITLLQTTGRPPQSAGRPSFIPSLILYTTSYCYGLKPPWTRFRTPSEHLHTETESDARIYLCRQREVNDGRHPQGRIPPYCFTIAVSSFSFCNSLSR